MSLVAWHEAADAARCSGEKPVPRLNGETFKAVATKLLEAKDHVLGFPVLANGSVYGKFKFKVWDLV